MNVQMWLRCLLSRCHVEMLTAGFAQAMMKYQNCWLSPERRVIDSSLA
jgi:hypothetical protein